MSAAKLKIHPFNNPPTEYGGMILICRAVTVEKYPSRSAARKCCASVAVGRFTRLRPNKCKGVVKYCASTGVANLETRRSSLVARETMAGSVKTKVKDTRSRANHTNKAVNGVPVFLLVLWDFPSALANIFANAESFAIPHVMLTSVTRMVATNPSCCWNGATVLADQYVAAYTSHTH